MILGPERVRIVNPGDGSEYPVEVVYSHTREDGVQIWRNVHPVPASVWGNVRVDVLPPKVAIEIITSFD